MQSATPPDPFGRSRRPRLLTREDRVRELLSAADRLIDGRPLDREIATWIGTAITAFLYDQSHRPRLDRHLDILAPSRSRETPQAIVTRLAEEATGASVEDSETTHSIEDVTNPSELHPCPTSLCRPARASPSSDS